ncbi:DNA/RNA non-specific endonuclease [Hymenobacter cellulosilyticus]|uniref:DNA/RNA non-specific endonuclease n=1 Tax=Hymenobacter cellulosilyticus TaxID=2932248 RepID=UPI0021D40159|nr:DNA/RNA non-specific endonuclease [Hymenobacter cellulosilyticus]
MGPFAKQANADTFHFTNSCPQMASVNQKTWVGLENHILKMAKADGMRINVYTGPFFSDADVDYRGAKIPLAFWKVVAIVTEDGRPSATAYKISQQQELSELEYIFAGYLTYQISVQEVMDQTGINFSALLDYDGFTQRAVVTGERTIELINNLDRVKI